MNQDLTCKHLIHKDEKKYFVLSLIISIIVYVLLLLSVEGIAIFLFLILVTFFANGLMLARIRTNGVRLSTGQFPEVYEKVGELCEAMKISKIPDVYVMESSGVLNAFATKYSRKNMIVLYSEFFDLINSEDKDELAFVIAHELAHISRKHIVKQFFILPAMGISLGKAYSRACEYTCDRIAANYINNAEAAMNGLTILAIGKTLYKKVDRSEYLKQSSMEKGFFAMLAEKSSTHPALPIRINEIQLYFGDSSNPVNFSAGTKKVKWILTGVTLAILTLAWIGFQFADYIPKVDNFISVTFSEDDTTAVIEAVARGDEAKVKELLDSGINPDLQDYDGWTPLMWAVQDGNISMADILLEAGADPNLVDYDEETALLLAIYQNNVDAIKTLAGAGAEVNLADSTGWTPLMSAASYGYAESVKALLEAGADPDSRDMDNFTAFLYAKRNGYQEVADLLKK